jgi:hypothetical protein
MKGTSLVFHVSKPSDKNELQKNPENEIETQRPTDFSKAHVAYESECHTNNNRLNWKKRH